MLMMVSMLVSAVGTVPMYWPSRMTVTRSEMRFSSSILCEMTMPTPCSLSWRMILNRSSISALFNAAVGSSRMRTRVPWKESAFGDFDHLLLGDGEFADQRFRGEFEVQAVEDRLRILVHLRFVDDAERVARFAADEDVVGDGEVVHQVEFLMDDADAQGLRSARSVDLDLLPPTLIVPSSFE